MGRVVIDVIMRGDHRLSASEEKFRAWVESGPDDLVAMFSTVYPPDDDPDQFEPFDVASLCVEERLEDGRIAVQCLDLSDSMCPAVWAHLETLARMGLERVKETA